MPSIPFPALERCSADPTTVVVDLDRHPIVVLHADRNRVSVRVPSDVGERLLDDAVSRELDRRGQPHGPRVLVESDVEAARPHPLHQAAEVGERGRGAERRVLAAPKDVECRPQLVQARHRSPL